MTTLSFLAALPAVLAITGFVVYRFLGTQRESGRVTGIIVEKLRVDLPERSQQILGLPPRELSRELVRDHQLRTAVGEHSFSLLQQALGQEHTRSILVYILCALLFLVGVASFVFTQLHPAPLTFANWRLQSTVPLAAGLAVDTDELKLSWVATGPSEDISITLENVQTGRRTDPLRVAAATGFILFEQGRLAPLLDTREFKQRNRVRAIARTKTGDVISDEFALHVGLKIWAAVDPAREDLLIAAMIDNRLVQGYKFEAKAMAHRKTPPRAPNSWGGEISGKTDLSIPDFKDYDWSTLKVFYMGPDDLSLIRCDPDGS